MTATTQAAPPRIVTIDIVRGVAVMGILAMNIVAFAMPQIAYMNPAAYGMDDTADLASWVFNFVFVDGKMRGLFSFLFGASMLLVIEAAAAKGEPAGAIHFRRMLWLLVFGLLHYALIWFGDILTGYALIGMVAWLFRTKPPRVLVQWGAAFVTVQFLLMALMALGFWAMSMQAAAPGAEPEILEQWQEMRSKFAVPSPESLRDLLALHRGGYGAIFHDRAVEHGYSVFLMTMMFAAETLGYMLFGMAMLKSGFLTGAWDDAAYRSTALRCLAIAVPLYALLAWALVAADFSATALVTIVLAATVPIRPLMVVAYAALIILATRGGGRLVGRIAAAGRAAFTNYLGTSLVMTTLFYGYGFGLFGYLGRAELWLLVIAACGVMLLWSKPWLDRFRYGPFEWLWRSLARGSFQPMRKPAAIPAAAE